MNDYTAQELAEMETEGSCFDCGALLGDDHDVYYYRVLDCEETKVIWPICASCSTELDD